MKTSPHQLQEMPLPAIDHHIFGDNGILLDAALFAHRIDEEVMPDDDRNLLDVLLDDQLEDIHWDGFGKLPDGDSIVGTVCKYAQIQIV